LRLSRVLLPYCAALTIGLIGLGLYLGLFVSPEDYQQGDTVRIMYVHVPSAWMALFTYMLIAVASGVGLVWRHPLAFMVARAAAPLGAAFTALALITGSLWGKPMWGTWWEWDGRLTSVLILFFIYLGHIALSNAFDDQKRGDQAAAVLGLVGVVIVPIIKFSVDWWYTLHQPASVFRLDGPTIHESQLWPLMIMALGFMFYLSTMVFIRVREAIFAAKLRALQIRLAQA